MSAALPRKYFSDATNNWDIFWLAYRFVLCPFPSLSLLLRCRLLKLLLFLFTMTWSFKFQRFFLFITNIISLINFTFCTTFVSFDGGGFTACICRFFFFLLYFSLKVHSLHIIKKQSNARLFLSSKILFWSSKIRIISILRIQVNKRFLGSAS